MMKVKTQLQNEKCKLKNEKWGRGSDRQSSICNLQFTICNLHIRRRGLSLTEVLIAMGILTLGLLGVASVFPVASYYMQKADNYDISSSLAQEAMNEIVTRGFLDPWAWFVIVPPGSATASVGSPNYLFSTIDSAYAPHATGSGPLVNSYTRPFAESLTTGQNLVRGIPNIKDDVARPMLEKQFGCAYVIDPIGVAAVQRTQGQSINNPLQYGFPSASIMAYAPGKSPIGGWNYYNHAAWNPWKANTIAPANPTELTWPIRRVTFRQSSTGWNLDKQTAEHYFQMQDDLSYDFPARNDRPSMQTWDLNPTTGTPLARKWTGDYSWIATVAPRDGDGRDQMATNPGSVVCDVSVVVLYKRLLPADVLVGATDSAEAVMPERAVAAAVVSTGLNGGELLLRDMGDGVDSPYKYLKSSQWMLVCGPHPNSSPSAPRFFLNWYQIVSIETSNSALITNTTTQRVVTLRGPEWPWQPAPTGVRDYSHLSNDLCGGIIKGAIAVHSKSMALQDSMRVGLPSFGAPGKPANVSNEQTGVH